MEAGVVVKLGHDLTEVGPPGFLADCVTMKGWYSSYLWCFRWVLSTSQLHQRAYSLPSDLVCCHCSSSACRHIEFLLVILNHAVGLLGKLRDAPGAVRVPACWSARMRRCSGRWNHEATQRSGLQLGIRRTRDHNERSYHRGAWTT